MMGRRSPPPVREPRAPRRPARGTRPERTRLGEKDLVLLGLVAEEPTHAYRVEEKIRERRMSEWTEIGFSSIYRLLASLERRGLVRSHLEHAGQGATRKVHEVTPRGRRVLATGVLAQLGSLEPIRMPFQVGLAFVTHAPQAEVLARLAERAGHVERVRAHLEGLRRQIQAGPPARSGDGRSALAVRRWLTARLLLDHLAGHLGTEATLLARARRLVAAAGPDAFARRP